MALHIEQFRELKAATKELGESIVDDLAPFVHEKDNHTFVRLPTSKHINNDVGVTVTCSCLMALSLTGRLNDFVEKRRPLNWDAKKTFKLVVRDRYWRSSGLVKMNAFTSTLVLRAF